MSNYREDPRLTFPSIHFTPVRVCNYCFQETVERNEQTVCPECQQSLEGLDRIEYFECSKCKELCSEEKCKCN